MLDWRRGARARGIRRGGGRAEEVWGWEEGKEGEGGAVS